MNFHTKYHAHPATTTSVLCCHSSSCHPSGILAQPGEKKNRWPSPLACSTCQLHRSTSFGARPAPSVSSAPALSTCFAPPPLLVCAAPRTTLDSNQQVDQSGHDTPSTQGQSLMIGICGSMYVWVPSYALCLLLQWRSHSRGPSLQQPPTHGPPAQCNLLHEPALGLFCFVLFGL